MRHSAAVPTKTFDAIVLNGALKTMGMVSFAPVINPTQLESIRGYIVRRAHESKREQANVATAPVSPPSAVR